MRGLSCVHSRMSVSIFWPLLADFRSTFPVFAQDCTAWVQLLAKDWAQRGTKAGLLWGDLDSGPQTWPSKSFLRLHDSRTGSHPNSLSFCFPEGQISFHPSALSCFLSIFLPSSDPIRNPILSSSQSTQTNIRGCTLESETFDSNTKSSFLYPQFMNV